MNRTLLATLGLLAASPCLAGDGSVLTYHNGIKRHGLYTVPGLTETRAAAIHLDPNFKAAAFTGNVYAQPLYWKSPTGGANLLIVATESDQVLALNADTGAQVWSTQLGAAVGSGQLPCGDIVPEGVTGTPAIDPATGTLYLDALIETSSGPRQQIFALSVTDGAIRSGWPIDVQSALAAQGQTFDSTTQGERSAALFFNGNIYVDYAARSGDCGSYHGDVVQVQASTATITGFWSTRANGGGIWAQGGAAGDGQDLYVTTGNTFNADNTWQDGEAIIRLKPGLAHSTDTKDFYAPTNWQSLDNEDADLGGTEALPLSIGGTPRVIAMGKDGNAYLVNRANLGGIGGQIAITQVSNSGIITAPAVKNTGADALVAFTSYSGLSCSGTNITMLEVAASGATPIGIKWCGAFNGRGAPIITTSDGQSNALVWVTGAEGDNRLHAFDANTGAVVFAGGTGPAMTGLRHFGTLIAANHHLYVGADNTVFAYTY